MHKDVRSETFQTFHSFIIVMRAHKLYDIPLKNAGYIYLNDLIYFARMLINSNNTVIHKIQNCFSKNVTL